MSKKAKIFPKPKRNKDGSFVKDPEVFAAILEKIGQYTGIMIVDYLKKCQIEEALKQWKRSEPHNGNYSQSGLLRFWKSFLEQVTRTVFKDAVFSTMTVTIDSDFNWPNTIKLEFKTGKKQ